MKKAGRFLRFLEIVSVIALLTITNFAFSTSIIKEYMDVSSDDPDYKEPAFIKSTTQTPGAPAKLKITACKTSAYTYQFTNDYDITTNENQYIKIILDIVDANGNIVNKQALTDNPAIMINLNITETGSTAKSYLLIGAMTYVTPPMVYFIETGSEIIIENKEAENLNITASASAYGFADSETVSLQFSKSATLTGNLVIPSASAAKTLQMYLYNNMDEVVSMKTYPVQASVTSYPFTLDGFGAGNYLLRVMPTHNPSNTNLAKTLTPICGNSAPYNNIVFAEGEDKNLGNVNLPFSNRGGIKGTISIQGRAAGDLSNTTAFVVANPEDMNACLSYTDMMTTLVNSGTQTQGSQYSLMNLQAGTYIVSFYVEDMTTQKYEWMKLGTVSVANGAWSTLDVTTEPFSGITPINMKYFETLIYKQPSEKQYVVSNPTFVWQNVLSKDANVPAGTTADHCTYTITVSDRCNNTLWEQTAIPHNTLQEDQSLEYGSDAKGAQIVAPAPLSNGQLYKWEIVGHDEFFNFAFPENSTGWNFLGFGTPAPTSNLDGGLRIISQNNTNNFGFWQSPQAAITYIPNEDKADIYRVRFMVSCPNAPSREVVPQFRCRVNSNGFTQYDFLNILSQMGGEACPLATPQPYDLYFVPSAFDNAASIAFDIVNIDVNDMANGELLCSEITIEKTLTDAIKNETVIASYTFDSGDEGWLAGGGTINTAANGKLNLKSQNNVNNFGFWANPANRAPYIAGKLYRAKYIVTSDSTKAQCPQIRFRFGSSDQQVQMVQGITSMNDGIQSPDSSPMEYNLVFYPPAYMPSPEGFFVSIDSLNIDQGDKADATVSIDSVDIYTYDLPFAD